MSQQFTSTDVLRLEIEDDPDGLVNLVQNPSGELGGWGWVSPVAGSSVVADPDNTLLLRYTPALGVPNWFYTEPLPIREQEYAAASWEGHPDPTSHYYRTRFEWLDSTLTVLGESTPTDYIPYKVDNAESYGPHQAPVSAAYVRLRFDLYSDTLGDPQISAASLTWRKATVATAATSGELGTFRENLVPNPGFTTDTSGWSRYANTTIEHETAEGYSGTTSLGVRNLAEGPNLVPNPDFETNAAGWGNLGGPGTVTHATNLSYSGAASLRIRADSGGMTYVKGGQTATGTAAMPVTGGRTYRASAHVWVGTNFGTDNYGYLNLDWYDAAGALLGTDAGAYFADVATYTWRPITGTVTAPADAAYARARFEFVTNQPGGSSGPTNNYVDDVYLAETLALQDAGALTDVPILGGRTYTLSAYQYGVGDRAVTWRLSWLDAEGAAITWSTHAMGSPVGWERFTKTVTAPAGAVELRWRFLYDALAYDEVHFIDSVMVEEGSTLGPYIEGAQATADLSYVEPVPYLNVLGPTHDIKVTREALNTGTLTATILDANLDPSTDDLIRPGRRCRLTVDDGGWEPLFTGKVSAAKVSYHYKDPAVPETKRARIELTATDNLAPLANTNRAEGVATIEDLPYVLEGCGVPWNVNGSGDQVPTATVVALNENASAVDQVAVTRDSVLGHAWVDRQGVLQARDKTALDASGLIPNPSFDDDATGWAANDGTIEHSTDLIHSAPGAGKFTANASGRPYLQPVDFQFTVTPETSYVLSAWVNIPADLSQNYAMAVEFYSDFTNWAYRGDAGYGDPWLQAATDGWVYLDVPFTVPADTTGMIVYPIVSQGTSTAADVIYLDDVRLRPTPKAFLDESAYTDLDLDFDTERCINEVNIKFLRHNPSTGETEEIDYGPYRDETSIREWGVRSAEFTIQGIAEEVADLDEFAQAVLAANATPQLRVNHVTVAVADPSLPFVGLDLMDLVTVANGENLTSDMRIHSLEHSITPEKWLTTYGFEAEGSVAAPQFTPSPQTGAGGKTIGQLLRPVGEVTSFLCAKAAIPEGWLALDGSTFDETAYPDLYAMLGSNVLPDATDRFLIGAGTKGLLTTGGSPTTIIQNGNLPGQWVRYISNTASTAGGQTRVSDVGNVTGASGGSTANAGGDFDPLDVMNPWVAVWPCVRAR